MSKCLIGFDGYIDELYSVVKKRSGIDGFVRYEKIEDFGNRVLAAAGKSADIEIAPCKVKIGGNAPILANALASLGYETVCIGQMDGDTVSDPFQQMVPSCRRISTGKASKTTALEFADGKIMLGNLLGNHIGWETIKEKVGAKNLYQMIQESDLIGIVNWGGMYRMNEIMAGLYHEVLILLKEEQGQRKEIFIDLSDPSARSSEDMERLFELIQSISTEFPVTLGMNENEAGKIGKRFCQETGDMKENGKAIQAGLKLQRLVIHTNQKVYGFQENQIEEFSGMYVENPMQTTGAGDHFNAGFCMGILDKRSLYESLILGQAMASCYISNGIPASKDELEDYIMAYRQMEGKEEKDGRKFLS